MVVSNFGASLQRFVVMHTYPCGQQRLAHPQHLCYESNRFGAGSADANVMTVIWSGGGGA